MKHSRGFTVIELIAAVLLVSAASILFFIQKSSIETTARDTQRKTAINAMYYSLEKSFHVQNQHYPASIGPDVLTTMDPELFTDPAGVLLGESGSDYRYEPTGCTDGKCTGYTLRADLEKEADFIKTSAN